jgi:hypothetical protein
VLQLAAISGTTNVSDTMTVNVSAYVPDTTPPVVTITAPANGANIVSGTTVNVSATITDNVAVQSGAFYVDGNYQSAVATAPFAWTANGLSLGAHTLAVRGVDIAGNAATNSVSITIIVAPPVVAGGIAQDSFETYAAGTLSGANGGTGWAAAWAASVSVINAAANPLTFTPAGGLPLNPGTNAVEVTSTAGGIAAARQLGSALPNVFYIGYLVRLNAGGGWGGTNTVSVHLADSAVNTATSINFGIRSGTAGQFMVRNGTGTPGANSFTGGTVAVGTNYFIVARLSKLGTNGNATATWDRLEMWVNPAADADQTTPVGNARLQLADGAGLATINHVLVRHAALDADDRVWIDHLILGTNWADVVPSGPVPDTLPPVAGFITPTNGQAFYVGQAIPVSVSATDNVVVQEVYLSVDTLTNEVATLPSAPYEHTLSGLAVGPHPLIARVIDTSYNTTLVTNSITVLALPTLNVLPASGGIQLNWAPTNWLLEASTNLAPAAWSIVPGAISPYSVPTTQAYQFFRLRLP